MDVGGKMLQTLLDRLNVGVLRLTVEGELVDANRACRGLLERFGVDAQPNALLEAACEVLPGLKVSNDAAEREVELTAGDGQSVCIYLSLLRIRVNGHDAIDVLVEDVTKMRRSTERNEELEKANRALESFAYTVSHDLRAPLRNLQGYVRAIKEDCFGGLDENCRNHVEAMDDITVKMDGMIAEVLEFSRVSRSDLPSEHVELGPVLDESLALVKNTIEEKAAQVEVAIDRNLVVLGHHPTLVQALTNLLSNALKFVPEGARPVLRVRSERRNVHRIRVWVEDEGIGIDPSQHKRIFEVFQRLHGEEKYPGTGIGLALVKERVEGMGGHVGVESSRDAGSRFWVELRAGS